MERREKRPIYGLTVWNPWAYCIAHKGKRVENRGWSPSLEPGDFLAIHAGRVFDESAVPWLRQELGIMVPVAEQIVSSAIVAVATFEGVELKAPIGDRWWAGPVGWRLADVVALAEPVPCRGARGLWELPEDVLVKVKAGYRAAKGGGA